jgi:acetaldehyde dehydrogenase/alcohol dehydrogenase
LALKTRNGIVLAPHPRASKCTIEAARIVRDAAVAAGAPENIISWIDSLYPSKDETFELMQNSDMIIAAGGPAMVKSSYSSGTPAIGVGAGNTPAIIDESADIPMAVNYILLSKTFDLGVICASEQAVVVLEGIADKFLDEMTRRGAVVLREDDVMRVREGLFSSDGRLNPDTVGKRPSELASMFGLQDDRITESTRLLLTPSSEIGPDEVLSGEKLCPILALYTAHCFDDALNLANELVQNGGAGHTSVIYSENIDHIHAWEDKLKTVQMLVNMPSSQGAIGDLYNNLDPSLTLGCGSFGHTSVSNNVQCEHLLNFKAVANRKEHMQWFRVPRQIHFKEGCLRVALRDLRGKKRAFIVTDKPLLDLGYVEEVQGILDSIKCQSQVFYHVKPDPDIESIRAGAKELSEYAADVIIALGGGSPMDAAKIMWLLYADSNFSFEGVATRFMDIRKRIYDIPQDLHEKAMLVCIPTTSGTGSEVTPLLCPQAWCSLWPRSWPRECSDDKSRDHVQCHGLALQGCCFCPV